MSNKSFDSQSNPIGMKNVITPSLQKDILRDLSMNSFDIYCMLCALHVHFLFKFTPYEEGIIISCLRDKKIVVPRDKVTCPKLHSLVRGGRIEPRSVRSLALDRRGFC